MNRPFSFNVITSSLRNVRNGYIEFQKLLLVKGWFSTDFRKILFFSCLFQVCEFVLYLLKG